MLAKFSLIGGVLHVMSCLADYVKNARLAEFKRYNYTSPLAIRFPGWGFESLPAKVQSLIIRQLRLAEKDRQEFIHPP
jgi:hypothetical protein